MVLILALLTGGCAGKTTVLSDENAIQQVLKEHPDFPAKSAMGKRTGADRWGVWSGSDGRL